MLAKHFLFPAVTFEISLPETEHHYLSAVSETGAVLICVFGIQHHRIFSRFHSFELRFHQSIMEEFQICCVIQWTIEKFSLSKILKTLRSSTFREESSNRGWYMKLCLKSCDKEGFISLELCNESRISGTFNCTISIIDSCGSLHFLKNITTIISGDRDTLFRISDFIECKELFEKKASLLPNDTLTVQCIIRKPYKLQTAIQSVNFEQFSYTWPITNFSSIKPNDCKLSYPLPLRFEKAPILNLEFHLVANSGAESNIFIKVNKHNSDTYTTTIFASYEISTININESKIDLFCGEFEFLSSYSGASHSSPVVKLHEFHNGEGILIDDTLTLVINLLIADSKLHEQNYTESFCYPTHQKMNLSAFQGNLYEKIYEDKKFCDVVLKVGTSSLRAHRAVLHAQSPVFRAMLDSDMTESNTAVIEIVDFDADTMDRFLQFLYTGKMSENLQCEDILMLYVATHKYQVPYLNTMRSLLISKITVQNVWKMWFSTVKYEDDVLKAALISYISEHTSESLNMLASVEEVAAAPKLGSCLESTNEDK